MECERRTVGGLLFSAALCLVIGGSIEAGPVEAQEPPTVLWMSDAAGARNDAAALAVELAPRRVQVALGMAPPGATPATRAIAARGAARANAADAALWVEAEADGSRSIRAVAADTELTAWAPLPDEAGDPRLVALIAASLLDDLLRDDRGSSSAGSLPAVRVSLRLRLGDALTPPSPGDGAESAPRPPRERLAAPAPPPPSRERRDFYFEFGPTFAGVAVGGNVGIGTYVTPWLRWDLHQRVTWVFLADTTGAATSTSLAFVTSDDAWRFEAGAEAGVVVTEWNGNVGLGMLLTGLVGLSGGIWDERGGSLGRLGVRGSFGLAYLDESPGVAGWLELYLQVSP